MTDASSAERAAEYGVVANVCEPDAALRLGAKVWILRQWVSERVYVYGLSRGGRKIEKWVMIGRLNNFRPAWAPETDRPFLRALLGDKDAATNWAELFNEQACRRRDPQEHLARRGR